MTTPSLASWAAPAGREAVSIADGLGWTMSAAWVTTRIGLDDPHPADADDVR